MFPPQGKIERGKNPFLPPTVVNIWRSLGADWFLKQLKTKQPFYAPFRVPEVHWAGWWMLSQNLKKKILVSLSLFPAPNLDLFQRALWAKQPNLKPLLPKNKHILVSIENCPTIWTLSGDVALMTAGDMALYLKSALSQDKVSFISHSSTMEGHPNYDVSYN